MDQNGHKMRNKVRQRPRLVGQMPVHRSGQIPRLGLQPLDPLGLAGAAQRPVRLFGQRPVVPGVPAPDLAGVGAGGQPLGQEGADGLQYQAAGAGPGVAELDQAVPGQRFGLWRNCSFNGLAGPRH